MAHRVVALLSALVLALLVCVRADDQQLLGLEQCHAGSRIPVSGRLRFLGHAVDESPWAMLSLALAKVSLTVTSTSGSEAAIKVDAGDSTWAGLFPSSTVAIPAVGNTDLLVSRDGAVECHVDYLPGRTVAFILVALVLMFNARGLSKSASAFYATGVTAGMLLSIVLLLLIVVLQFRNRVMHAFAVITTLGTAFVIQPMLSTSWGVMQEHWQLCVGYFAFFGVISFIYLYMKGPPTNTRVLDIIRWSIYVISLVLLYFAPTWVFARRALLGVGIVAVPLARLVGGCCRLVGCGWLCCCCRSRGGYKPLYISRHEYETQSKYTTMEQREKLLDRVRDALPGVTQETALELVQEAITPIATPRRRTVSPRFAPDGGLMDPDDVSDIDDEDWDVIRQSPTLLRTPRRTPRRRL